MLGSTVNLPIVGQMKDFSILIYNKLFVNLAEVFTRNWS